MLRAPTACLSHTATTSFPVVWGVLLPRPELVLQLTVSCVWHSFTTPCPFTIKSRQTNKLCVQVRKTAVDLFEQDCL